MSRRFLMLEGTLAIVIAVASLSWVAVAGQTPTVGKKPLAAQTWSSPRTPDGHPDLQGIWNAATITPLERPDAFAGKAMVTDAEATTYAKEFLEASSLDRRDGGPERDRSRAYPDYFTDRGTQLARVNGRFRTSGRGSVPPSSRSSAAKGPHYPARKMDAFPAVALSRRHPVRRPRCGAL